MNANSNHNHNNWGQGKEAMDIGSAPFDATLHSIGPYNFPMRTLSDLPYHPGLIYNNVIRPVNVNDRGGRSENTRNFIGMQSKMQFTISNWY